MNDLPVREQKQISSGLRSLARANDVVAGAIVSCDLLGLAACTYVSLGTLSSWGALSSILAGLFMGFLFIVGHDCCHQAFFQRRWLNEVVGRLAFIFVFHSYSLWEIEHNWRHHAFTNIAGSDHAYSPMSLEGFRQASVYRRLQYRWFRSLLGLPFYYLIDVHLRFLIFPQAKRVKRFRFAHFADCALVLIAFTSLNILLLTSAHPFRTWILGFAIPQLVWNILVTVVTLQQHTHPEVPWFGPRDDWKFYAAQVNCTTEITLGLAGDRLFHNVFIHPVHHLHSKVPLYRLPQGRMKIAQALSEFVLFFTWSVRGLGQTLAACKLYDFDEHCWTDFSGKVTARIPPARRPSPACSSDLPGVGLPAV